MRGTIVIGIVAASISLYACSRTENSEPTPMPSVIFNLSDDHLGTSNAASLLKAIKGLASKSVNPTLIQFTSGDEVVTFEVIVAEPRDDYDKWIHVEKETGSRLPSPIVTQKTQASPPGGIDLTWIHVTPEDVRVGDSSMSDTELADWLRFYAGAIGGVRERSALVIEADKRVQCDRLFGILRMLNHENLDRFLIERRAEQVTAPNP